MAKLKSADQDFRFRFRQLLEGYLKQLEETPAVAEKATSAGTAHEEFARHAEAIKAAIEREGQSGPAAAGTRRSAARAGDEPASRPTRPTISRPCSRRRRTPPSPPSRGRARDERKKDRILFGESDDILSDVDSGVNENEFKW